MKKFLLFAPISVFSKNYFIDEISLANGILKSHRRTPRDNSGLYEETSNIQDSYERECREQQCDNEEFQEATKNFDNRKQLEIRIRRACQLGNG